MRVANVNLYVRLPAPSFDQKYSRRRFYTFSASFPYFPVMCSYPQSLSSIFLPLYRVAILISLLTSIESFAHLASELLGGEAEYVRGI